MNLSQIRTIAIHLPQFHPVPENDQWWGKGFTEWTNVAKARPLYPGHYQPHIPADLGFYDLRLAEARKAQSDLAKSFGIHGFCYYHYWFNGRRILERPVEEIVKSGEPDFPFMLCWANENWTRVWDGGERDVLLQQNYSSEDDRAHMEYLVDIFKDPRYIRIDNKPVFAVYRSTLFPDIKETIDTWREVARSHGIELYLIRFESGGQSGKQLVDVGFDAAVEFQPQVKFDAPDIKTLKDGFSLSLLKSSLTYRANRMIGNLRDRMEKRSQYKKNGNIFFYREYMNNCLRRYDKDFDYKLFRGVCPGWDNSPRRSMNYTIMEGSTPELFEEWVTRSVASFKPYSKDENLFFVNAWNEWAEGNHLEPCLKWKTSYLEALKSGLDEAMNRIKQEK
jgi:lipopolysaccharide biosynthesis protein